MDQVSAYDSELAALQRKQRLAALLMQQGYEGTPVLSPWQGVARVAAAIMGNMQSGEADRGERDLAQRRSSERQAEMDRILTASTGNDRAQLARLLARSADPTLQQAGLAMALKTNDEEFGTEPREVMGPDGKPQMVLVGKRGTIRPMSGFAPPPKFQAVSPGASLVQTGGDKPTPVFQGPSKEVTDFTEVLKAAGIDPASPEGQHLFKAYATKQATHQPPTQVNVDTTNKPFATTIGEGLGKDFNAARAAAQSAVRANQVADQAETLLNSGAFTGAGATITLKAGKIVQSAGLGKYVDPEKIANTEALISNLAQQTLANLRQSGLGGGSGFSNADRDFLEKATGGSIEMNESSLRKLIQLNRKSNANVLQSFDQQAAELEKRPEFKGIPLRLGVPSGRRTVDDLVDKYGN